MSYERITPRDLVETINMPQGEDMTRFLLYTKRLWEIENAIEQGELVDTRSYFAQREFLPSGKARFQICRRDTTLAIRDFADTKEEAERKVEELNKGKNDIR